MKISLHHLPLDHLHRLHKLYRLQNSDIRLVGGCVRDIILERPVFDIDLATPLPPEEGMKLLQANHIHVIPTGLKHGTITAVIDHRPYEITTLRHDVETYGRHADVSFSADWHEDANRRDFTINGLYAHIEDGTVEDYHDGLTDLKQGIIRFIGDAERRISEDYLRILRFFRFYAWYGQTSPSWELLGTIQRLSPGLKNVARERIRTEFLKLLKGPKARDSLDHMGTTQVFSFVTSLNPQLEIPLEEERLSLESLLFAMFIRKSKDIDHLTKDLRLSNKQRQHLIDLDEFNRLYPHESLNYLIFRLGTKITGEGLLLRSDSPQAEEAFKKQIPPFPLKGDDLSISPGPKLGLLLKECQRWWAGQSFSPSKEDCLEWIKNYLESSKR